MNEDPEIKAMTAIAALLDDMDEEARTRVLVWASQRFAGTTTPAPGATLRHDRDTPSSDSFAHFADLYDRVGPSTNGDRLVVGGYWCQVVEGSDSFTAQQVNNLLKDVGHGVSSIAKVFSALQERSPALVRQLSKSGRSQQARKTYKLTAAGINEIASRL